MPPVELERVLTERASAGDATAFRQIYDRQAPAVHRFLCDLLGDRSAADEATQETFVRAHAALTKAGGGVRDVDKLRPWLMGIARNVSFEAWRRIKKDGPMPAEESPEVGEAPSPETMLLHREADRILARAMAALTPDRRAALLLHMDHGMPYADIATALGWSLAKVKVEIHRARQSLRAEVTKYLGEMGS
jgi:RNA polymerase sigma-70 factor, ECF subfamily